MIVIRRYLRSGNSEKFEFKNKIAALLWLSDHIEDCEWCWIMYDKKECDE